MSLVTDNQIEDGDIKVDTLLTFMVCSNRLIYCFTNFWYEYAYGTNWNPEETHQQVI